MKTDTITDRDTMIYAAQYSKPNAESNGFNTYIAAGGGGGANDIRIFNTSAGKCVAMVENCVSAFFTLAFSLNGRMLAAGIYFRGVTVGGGSKTLYVYDIDPSVAVDFNY
jgi:hypothetical protein